MNLTSVAMGGRAPPQRKPTRSLRSHSLDAAPGSPVPARPADVDHPWRPRSCAGIDLGLLHPAPQRVPVDAQLFPDPTTSAGYRQLQLLIGQKIIDQTDRPITNLGRMLLRC